MCPSQGFDESQPGPFKRFAVFVKKVRMYIRGFPRGSVRKITALTPAQIQQTVESMFVGGFAMLQVRALPRR